MSQAAHGAEGGAGGGHAANDAAGGHGAPAAAHAAGGGHAAHGGHGKSHKSHAHDAPPGTPPWLISFGDMMTLFLCFFIMLVTMASRQDAGLMANGLGSYMASSLNNGMTGALTGEERLQAVNLYRERFGLAPLESLEESQAPPAVSNTDELRALLADGLRPRPTIAQPLVASFERGSSELSEAGRHYLDLLAESLRPGPADTLLLEGHAADAGGAGDPGGPGEALALAHARALEVARHLIDEHYFVTTRVEARAWAREPAALGAQGMGVDARLVSKPAN